jgi:predicted regulator of Ras-like GTPase activity (Roadblock/LC7/MglB family)
MTATTRQNGAGSVHDAEVEPVDLVLAELARLRELVSGVQGCVIAGVDGLLVLHDLGNSPEPHDLAALAAATFGVGRQCGLALRHGPFRESTLRSHRGYFTVYAIGETALLAVLGDERMNVARLHLEARLVIARLAELIKINVYHPDM